MSAEYFKDNYLSIDVFFDDFQVTTTTTKYTYGVEALLGEIGGLLGLFIGVNIINFFELLMLCVDGLKNCFQLKRKKTNLGGSAKSNSNSFCLTIAHIPSIESGTPPAESEMPPTESETPPAESEMPPAESETPPD
uniref:Uncharacterized protein n=1 Tax=Amphimedon queenslandica TaxID=400682 RepID=A0A1X7TEY9_AMPQE